MKTAKRILIVLLLVGVVASAALLLVAAAGTSQGLLKDLVLDEVVNKVDGHPTVDATVDKIPNDCLKCHGNGGHEEAFSTTYSQSPAD